MHPVPKNILLLFVPQVFRVCAAFLNTNYHHQPLCGCSLKHIFQFQVKLPWSLFRSSCWTSWSQDQPGACLWENRWQASELHSYFQFRSDEFFQSAGRLRRGRWWGWGGSLSEKNGEGGRPWRGVLRAGRWSMVWGDKSELQSFFFLKPLVWGPEHKAWVDWGGGPLLWA